MNVVHSIDEVRAALEPHRAGKTIALVPTMGAFHAGHVALFRAARAAADVVVASLFVNPAQFDDPTDLDGYPHDAAHDAKVARKSGVDLLFVGAPTQMRGLRLLAKPFLVGLEGRGFLGVHAAAFDTRMGDFAQTLASEAIARHLVGAG